MRRKIIMESCSDTEMPFLSPVADPFSEQCISGAGFSTEHRRLEENELLCCGGFSAVCSFVRRGGRHRSELLQ